MGALDLITQMKHQGVSDQEIMTALREQGISPKEINEGFAQSKIKNAVSNPQNKEIIEEDLMETPPTSRHPNPSQNIYTPQTQEIQEPNTYVPTPQQEPYAPTFQPQEESYLPTPQPQEEYYPQENYNEGYEDYNSEASTDTTIEISEQIFEEKIKKTSKKVTELNEFKNLAETKIENISQRLKRIETIIDKLQISILDKIGSYGENLGSIKKEMSMMQDSFGKLVGSAIRKKEHPTKKKTHTMTHPKKK